MIEVEKRGYLNNENLKRFKNFLEKEGKLIGKYNQLGIFIEFDNPFLGSLEDTKASINVALTNNILENKISCKLKSKSGNMQSSARVESSIPFQLENIKDVFNFLNTFNITTGCPRFYYREDYSYKNFTISIKERGLAPNHFEIETEVNTDSEVDDATNNIAEFIKEFGLSLYSEEEYKKIMLKVFKENPPIPLTSINLGLIN